MQGSTDHRSRLFHAIVVVGAAFGAGCGGAIETANRAALDASGDSALDGPGEPPLDAPDDARPEADSVADRVAPEGGDAAPDAPNVCSQPGSENMYCPPCSHCVDGGCLPCFV
jgi:hypothetical protein